MRLLYFFLVFSIFVWGLLLLVPLVVGQLAPLGNTMLILLSPLIIISNLALGLGYLVAAEYIGKKIGVL